MKRQIPSRRSFPSLGLGAVALALVALATPGCFRATGARRQALTVEEIPVAGGRRVEGLKSAAGPGDYYLGNDFVELAVDGTRFIPGEGIVGGGSILDVSYVGLDTNYQAVSMPGDQLERLSLVVNQDPDLPLVFELFQPLGGADLARLEARGHLLDPKGKLGLPRDAAGRVTGVEALHSISLGKLDRYILMETSVTNRTGGEIPLRSIGDFLQQSGGGFRVVVPATETLAGQPVTDWGASLPGASFSNPLANSVKATMVTFRGHEPGAATLDSHTSLGILPLDEDQAAVIADPQPSLTENRPRFASRTVVGRLPQANLPSGATLTYRRRLYIGGGYANNVPRVYFNTALFTEYLPAQAIGLQNLMIADRATLRNGEVGGVAYETFGTATPGGPRQTEIRFERNTGTSESPVWKLERVEWRELGEIALGAMTPTILLPTGTYRVIVSNREQSLELKEATNARDTDHPGLAVPLKVEKEKFFEIAESLAPERLDVTDPWGYQIAASQFMQTLSTRGIGGAVNYHLQPARFSLESHTPGHEPAMQRTRSMAGGYDAISKAKQVLGQNFGTYQFRAGNEAFGASVAAYSPLTLWTASGPFTAYCTRGPLSYLDSLAFTASPANTYPYHEFIVAPAPLPAGWVAFDVPGPSQATTGGMLPAEMLSSALAEGVNVVALAEQDRHAAVRALYNDYRSEFFISGFTAEHRSALGDDPMVLGGRATDLRTTSGAPAYGSVVALSVPEANAEKRGGARNTAGWTLADFLAQSQGQFHVVRRPRDPRNGLFTLQGFSRTTPLGQGANAWWNASGPLGGSLTHGRFDALELIHAEGFDAAQPAAWFDEFKAVRADWFALLNQQTPDRFTKGLGCSGALYSLDNPVGHARTYLKVGATAPTQDALEPVLNALRSGAAVASTGPLLDVTVNGAAPGGSTSAGGGSVTVQVNLYAPDWVPVDEVRLVVNGQVVQTIPVASLQAGSDWRLRTGSFTLSLPAGKDAWVVVEAGVPLATGGPYAVGTPWARIMKGMYPIAVANPVFLDVNGGGYTPPGL